MNLTILIITKNAGHTLKRTLESVVHLKSDVIVIDDYSTDETTRIARAYGCKVITQSEVNFGKQRAFALQLVKTEWTLALDSDEVLTKKNREEINGAVKADKYNGYYLKFRNHLFGRKLNYGELHKKLVLFRTNKATIKSQEIHEQYEVEGTVGELPSEVLHFSYQSIGQIMRKFFFYSVLQAKKYKKENKEIGLRELLLNPLHMFYSRFIHDKGYKDGWGRFFLDYQFAHMEFLSYFLTPFVKERKRISVDCGSYSVGATVQSGIDRLIQGIYTHASNEYNYYWFGFAKNSPYRLPKRFFSQVWLPLKTIFNRSDIFLATAGTIPWLLSFFSIQKILFLHDFGFFSSPDKYNSSAKRLQNQTERSIQIADRIVLFHKEMYREFIVRYPQFCYKAHIIPAGADHLEKIEEKSLLIQDKKPLTLFVGVVKPVKRIDKIISAVGNLHCVIAGPQEREYKNTLLIGKTQNIEFIENFNDGQLKWLYKHADVMLYTSEHEGFCYPVLEALTLGLPVIAFDLPLFHEYQKYFSHLTLVKTIEEMKNELTHLKARLATLSIENPYKWQAFNDSLLALSQPRRLTEAKKKKFAFIFILYKTLLEEKNRLEKEIKNIGIKSYKLYWIDNSANGRGYAAGINEGIRLGLLDECDEFIALNPDISLKGITAEIIKKDSDEFEVWGLGMKQNGVVYYGGEIDKWRLSGGLVTEKPKAKYTLVDFVSGSIVGFSKNIVHAIGIWNESYFMYYEDVDYCIRAQKAGFQVGIDSEVVYDHFEVSKTNKKKEKQIEKSRWKFFWRHANVVQMIREIIRLPKTSLGL